MKKFVAAITLGAFLAIGGFAADKAKIRQKKQQKRIHQGVKTGELTKQEALKLEAKEAKLHRQIRKDRKDRGGLTPKERAQINKKQNKLSKEIYKDKHDKQKRDN